MCIFILLNADVVPCGCRRCCWNAGYLAVCIEEQICNAFCLPQPQLIAVRQTLSCRYVSVKVTVI